MKASETGLASLRGASDMLEQALLAVASAASTADTTRALALATEVLRHARQGIDAEAVAQVMDDAEEEQAEVRQLLLLLLLLLLMYLSLGVRLEI